MQSCRKVTALVLAGKRSGALDPLAARAGVAQKAVVPVNGVPMIERVVQQVAACPDVGAIRIVAHEQGEIAALPTIAALAQAGRLSFVAGHHNLVDSVVAGAEGAAFPVMITTADNCLVTPEGYGEFIDDALPHGPRARRGSRGSRTSRPPIRRASSVSTSSATEAIPTATFTGWAASEQSRRRKSGARAGSS
jgi:GTP:adenosylcobinamide-phosphate guanylyltransferase